MGHVRSAENLCILTKKFFVQIAQRISPLAEMRSLGLVLMITTCAIIPASRGRALTVGASTRVIVAILAIAACIQELGVVVIKRHIPGSIGGIAIAHRRIAVHHNFSFPFSVLISVSIIAQIWIVIKGFYYPKTTLFVLRS